MSGPTLIAAGMSILLLAIWSPSLPAVTAMSLVALRATDVTLSRLRGTPALLPIILLHGITYGGLYATFLGAALHRPRKRLVPVWASEHSWTWSPARFLRLYRCGVSPSACDRNLRPSCQPS